MSQITLLHILAFIFIAAFALLAMWGGWDEFGKIIPDKTNTPPKQPRHISIQPHPKSPTPHPKQPKPPKRPIGYGICMHQLQLQPLTIETKLDQILTQLKYNSEMLEYLVENRSN